MCFGGKSSSPQQQTPPPPNAPTTFDYNPARTDAQRRANTAVTQANTATVLSSTMGGSQFGSELGGAPPQPAA